MTNFDFLATTPSFSSFAEPAVAAEKVYAIDPAACVMTCRRAMENAVKWMYSVDSALSMPWDDKLVSLLSTEEFRDIVDDNLMRRLDYIRRVGNSAAHDGKRITKEQAMLCLQNLWVFMDFVAYCYESDYTPGKFDPSLPEAPAAPMAVVPPETEAQLQELMAENAALREELTARREEQQQTYTPKPLEISEYKTRKLYIDVMLEDAG
jgi:type I restriction enzyme R subunit